MKIPRFTAAAEQNFIRSVARVCVTLTTCYYSSKRRPTLTICYMRECFRMALCKVWASVCILSSGFIICGYNISIMYRRLHSNPDEQRPQREKMGQGYVIVCYII